MQCGNLFIYNTCNIAFKYIWLTLLAIYLSFCLACVTSQKQRTSQNSGKIQSVENALNINFATTDELEKLPQIGKSLAAKIVAHREKFGLFRRVENLILVKGMSDKKFREIKNLIAIE
jgi:competence ComEA-like helix-hairpin-helix protein